MVRLLALLFCFALAGCGNGQVAMHQKGDTLVRLAEDEVKSLDPQTVSDLASLRVAADQFEGLTRITGAGTAELGLAREMRVSADGLRYEFDLRKDARFSDGHPITPNLFPKLLARLRDPATGAPALTLFDAIDRIEAFGRTGVRVVLRYPFPALTELLAHPALAALPLHRPDWTEARPMVSSGAYRLSSWALGDQLVLEANPRWHGGTVLIQRIIWQPVADGLTAIRTFQSGDADLVGDIPSTRLERVRETMGQQVRIADYRGTYYFAFNTRRPPFDDVRVRRALNLAVEREWIAAQLMKTGVKPAWGVIPPGLTGLTAYQPDWAKLPRTARLARAKLLLAQAGYGPAKPLSFEIRFNSDTDHRRVAVALAAMWAPLGVEAKLLNSESSLHFASLRRADFAIARSGWIGDLSAPENFLAVHRSNSGQVNYSGYVSKSYDAALDTALSIPDALARAKAMRRAEAILVEDVPILPIYFYVSKSLVAPRVKGWQANSANAHPSRTLTLSPS